jgi:hypothetical protein
VPRQKNSPLRIKTPRELKGTIIARKGGNKTQAIVLHLIKRLPKPLKGLGYHVFLNNLFISTKFVKYTRSQGVGITSTCQDNRGVIQELLDLKKKDKSDVIEWGKTYSMPIKNSKVYQVG